MSFREVRCHHCDKLVTMTNKEEIIVFCDEGCLESFKCEINNPTKAETLEAVEFYRQYEEVI